VLRSGAAAGIWNHNTLDENLIIVLRCYTAYILRYTKTPLPILVYLGIYEYERKLTYGGIKNEKAV
jgi:hypothetical protein